MKTSKTAARFELSDPRSKYQQPGGGLAAILAGGGGMNTTGGKEIETGCPAIVTVCEKKWGQEQRRTGEGHP